MPINIAAGGFRIPTRNAWLRPKFLASIGAQLIGTCGCTFVPVTDLDASSSEDGQNATGGATSSAGASSTGGATIGGAFGTGRSQAGGATGSIDTANACSGTFTACGGDPSGTWDIVSVCVQGDLAAVANASYATDSSECSSLCTGATLTAQGSVTYNAGSLQPNAVLSISETLEMTASCYTALVGTTWSSSSCTSVAQMLDQQAGTTATCSSGSSGCDCAYTTATPASTDTYTVNGNSLIASDGSVTEFCVQGSTMFQRDSLGDAAYAVTQFSKR